ncbi:MAG TPA: hypothetical protein VGI70_15545, partial [Polyangiales bacterium]
FDWRRWTTLSRAACRVNFVSHNEYSVFFFVCPLILSACGYGAQPRDVRGALAAAANALESRDSEAVFHCLDERARFAMYAIVNTRRDARKLIEADYPPQERGPALAALGEAAKVSTAEELFARRCDSACLQTFADAVGAPVSQRMSGDEVVVSTVRGKTLRMHAGSDGGYGLVWNTEPLAGERSQAARELVRIRENAAVYRRRKKLEAR